MSATDVLVAGEQARIAVSQLLAHPQQVPAIEIDPLARAGQPIAVLAIGTPDASVLIDPTRTPCLAEMLSADRPWAAYDAKNVHHALLRTVGTGPNRWACIRLSEIVLAGGRDVSLELAAIASRYGEPPPPAAQAGFAELAALSRSLARLVAAQIPALRKDNLTRVSRIEAAAVSPIAAMESAGMPFDEPRWRALTQATSKQRGELREQIARLASQATKVMLFGPSVEWLDNDHQLVGMLRAHGLQVPNARRETLAALPEPWGPLLGRYRELTKVLNTYGESFLTHVAADGRIHPTFAQIGASTGRMACHSPNLQAMVKESEHHACFRCAEGRRIVTADYGACELRILAEMSRDPTFQDAFARGEDVHAAVASSVFGVRVSKTERPELRQKAKAINFGLVYGMGAGGLARAVGTDRRQAEELLEKYFTTFPAIRSFLERTAEQAAQRGYAQTMTGRRLYLDFGSDRDSHAQASRIAKNMPIQGTSADITKIALARVHARLAKLSRAELVNAVHDELVVECEAGEAEAVAAATQEEMILAAKEILTHTPIAVDVEIGDYWQ